MKTALCDGDVIVYTAGFGAERTLYQLYPGARQDGSQPILSSTHKKDLDLYLDEHGLEEYEIVRSSDEDPLAYALHKAKLILEKVISHTRADEIRVFLTADSSQNFRNEIATYRKYKGNRDRTRKPVWYHNIREYLVKHWGAELVEGQEADDTLGIMQTSIPDTVICSTDKDLKQIPGFHYNLVKETLVTVAPEEGLRQFYLQAMTGDSGDNILGAPGVGPKTAEKGLDMRDPWGSVIKVYKKALRSPKIPDDLRTQSGNYVRYKHWKTGREVGKGVEEFALEQAQLVYIRKREGEIWTPQM